MVSGFAVLRGWEFERLEENRSVLASDLVLFLSNSFPKEKEKGKGSF